MPTHVPNIQKPASQAIANTIGQDQPTKEHSAPFEDNRPEAIAQRKMIELANNSPQVRQMNQYQQMANSSFGPARPGVMQQVSEAVVQLEKGLAVDDIVLVNNDNRYEGRILRFLTDGDDVPVILFNNLSPNGNKQQAYHQSIVTKKTGGSSQEAKDNKSAASAAAAPAASADGKDDKKADSSQSAKGGSGGALAAAASVSADGKDDKKSLSIRQLLEQYHQKLNSDHVYGTNNYLEIIIDWFNARIAPRSIADDRIAMKFVLEKNGISETQMYQLIDTSMLEAASYSAPLLDDGTCHSYSGHNPGKSRASFENVKANGKKAVVFVGSTCAHSGIYQNGFVIHTATHVLFLMRTPFDDFERVFGSANISFDA